MAGHSKWANIQHRKGKQDAVRSKLFGKLAREITVAAKLGTPDPAMNPRLRAAILAARAENMPKDNIQRAIDKASKGDGENYEEIRYEGYGPGGVALIVEALTGSGSSADSPQGWSLAVPQIPESLGGVPDLTIVGDIDLVGGFVHAGVVAASLLVFTLVLANFFDAMGTMTALGRQAGVADADGNLPGMKRALVVEGLGAVVGGAASASSNTVYVDSSAGIADGARTGLANVVTGVLFLAAMFLTPLVNVVPFEAGGATTPDNLQCLSRRGHARKTRRHWESVMAPDGSVEWTSLLGQRQTTHPHDYTDQ